MPTMLSVISTEARALRNNSNSTMRSLIFCAVRAIPSLIVYSFLFYFTNFNVTKILRHSNCSINKSKPRETTTLSPAHSRTELQNLLLAFQFEQIFDLHADLVFAAEYGTCFFLRKTLLRKLICVCRKFNIFDLLYKFSAVF